MNKLFIILIIFTFCLATQGLAQEKSPGGGAASTFHAPGEAHHEHTTEEIAAKLANPNADLARLTFKNQFTIYRGDLPDAGDQWGYTMLFQPVFPFTLGETESGVKQLFFIRPAIPVLGRSPVFDAAESDFDDKSGLGDIGFDVAYVLAYKSGWEAAIGMTGTLPSGTDSKLTGGQLRIGPEVFLGKGGKFKNKMGYFWGLFPSHQWDVGGWRDGAFSTTKLEPLVTLVLKKGWTIGTDPIMSYDWQAKSGQRWTIPLNLKVAKTVAAGNTPVQLQLELNYYVERPDAFGPDWMIGLNVTPIVKNFIENMIKGK